MTELVSGCPEESRVEELLGKRESDEISALQNRWLIKHLDTCAGCGRRAVTEDPLLLLTPLSAGRDPGAAAYSSGRDDADLAFVRSGVDSLVRIDSFRRTLDRPRKFGWVKMAASLLVAVSAAAWFFGSGDRLARLREPAAPGTAGPLAPAPVSGATRLAKAAHPEVPWIENVSDPGAQVYQFSPTAPGEPLVVFVVSRNADL